MIAESPFSRSSARIMTDTMRNMNLTLLSAQRRLLNLSENMGISLTMRPANSTTRAPIIHGAAGMAFRSSWKSPHQKRCSLALIGIELGQTQGGKDHQKQTYVWIYSCVRI